MPSGSEGAQTATGEARTPPRRCRGAALDEPYHSLTMGPERLEQLEHELVVAPPLTEERERDLMAEVVVADADRVGVTERDPGDLGHGPRPDAGDRAESARQLGVLGAVTDSEAMPHLARPPDGVGPPALHPEGVEGPVGEISQPGRSRRDDETGLDVARCR